MGKEIKTGFSVQSSPQEELEKVVGGEEEKKGKGVTPAQVKPAQEEGVKPIQESKVSEGFELETPLFGFPIYSDESNVSSVDVEAYEDYLPSGVFENVGLDEARAQAQSNWERAGRAGVNILSEVTLGTLEGITAIPDVLQFIGSGGAVAEKQLENDITKFFREIKEDVSKSNQIFRERDSEGFSPGHASWWFENIPSIASAATFILPTMVIGKTIGAVGRVAKAVGKGVKLTSKLGKVGKTGKVTKASRTLWEGLDRYAKAKKIKSLRAAGLTEDAIKLKSSSAPFSNWASNATATNDFLAKAAPTIGGTIYSNGAESFQEAARLASEKYDEAKQTYLQEALALKEKGLLDLSMEEIEANAEKFGGETAAKVGHEIWTRNLINAPLDVFSTISILKPMKLTRMNLLSKGFKKKAAGVLAKEVIPEATQEGVNFISSAEATKAADAMIRGEEYDSNGFSRFVDEYYKSPDLWTGAFFGALGGLFMEVGMGPAKTAAQKAFSPQKYKGENVRKGLQQNLSGEIHSLSNNEVFFNLSQDETLHDLVYRHSKAGSMDKLIGIFEDFDQKTEEELSQFGIDRGKIEETIEKALKIEEQFIKIEERFGSEAFTNEVKLGFNEKLSKALWVKGSLERNFDMSEEKTNSLREELKLEQVESKAMEEEGYLDAILALEKVKELGLHKAVLKRQLTAFEKGTKKGTREFNKATVKRSMAKLDKRIKVLNKFKNNLQFAQGDLVITEATKKKLASPEFQVSDLSKKELILLEKIDTARKVFQKSEAYPLLVESIKEQTQAISAMQENEMMLAVYGTAEGRALKEKEVSSAIESKSAELSSKVTHVKDKAGADELRETIKNNEDIPDSEKNKILGELEIKEKKEGIKEKTFVDKAKEVAGAIKESIAPEEYDFRGKKVKKGDIVYWKGKAHKIISQNPNTGELQIAITGSNKKHTPGNQDEISLEKPEGGPVNRRQVVGDDPESKLKAAPISEELKEEITRVINNSNIISLSEDQSTYVNEKTGQVYKRVSDFISDGEFKSTPLVESALEIGNKVDVLVRDFFAGELKDLSEYNVSSKENIEEFVKRLEVIQEAMDKRGEVVLANDIVLYNDELGVAGTVDLLTYDKDGNVRIYDTKTMRGNQLTDVHKSGDNKGKIKYTNPYEKGKDSNKVKHQKQLSLYRILLNNTHGIRAKTVGVMPIEVSYNEGDTSSTKLNLLKGVELSPLEKVNTAELADTLYIDEQVGDTYFAALPTDRSHKAWYISITTPEGETTHKGEGDLTLVFENLEEAKVKLLELAKAAKVKKPLVPSATDVFEEEDFTPLTEEDAANRQTINSRLGKKFDRIQLYGEERKNSSGVIIDPAHDFYEKETFNRYKEVIRKADWADNVKIVSYRNEKADTTAKATKRLDGTGSKEVLYKASTFAMGLSVRMEDGTWSHERMNDKGFPIFVGHLENPTQLAYKDGKSIDFSDLNTGDNTELDTFFDNNFAISYSPKGKLTYHLPFDDDQKDTFREDYIKQSENWENAEAVFEATKGDFIDIFNVYDLNLYGVNTNELGAHNSVDLSSILSEVSSMDGVVDTHANIDALTGEAYNENYDSAIDKAKYSMPGASRYLTLVTLNNGLKVAVPTRPKVAAKANVTSTLKDSFRRKEEAATLPDITKKAIGKEISEELNSQIFFDGIRDYGIEFDSKVFDNELKLKINFLSEGRKVKELVLREQDLKSTKTLITRINELSFAVDETIPEITSNNVKQGIPIKDGKSSASIEEFDSLYTADMFKGYNIALSPSKNLKVFTAKVAVKKISRAKDKVAPIQELPEKAIKDTVSSIEDKINAERAKENPNKRKIASLIDQADVLRSTPMESTELKDNGSEFEGIEKVGKLDSSETPGIEKVANYVKSNLPEFISIKQFERVVDGVGNSNVTLGWFHQNVIGLMKGVEAGIGYHEAFHAVFRTLLTNEEINNYLGRVIPTITEEEVANFLEERPQYTKPKKDGSSYTRADILELVAEERLADDFQQYVETQDERHFLSGFFRLLTRLYNWFTGNYDAERLFRRIDKGYFKNSSIVSNKFTGSNVEPIQKVLKGATYDMSDKVIRTIASKVGESNIITGGEGASDNNLTDAINTAISEERKRYYKEFSSEKAKRRAKRFLNAYSYDNIKVIQSEVKKLLSYYSFDTVEDLLNNMDDDIAFESFNKAAYETGVFDSMSAEMKQFIGLSTYSSYDSVLDMHSDVAVSLSSLYPILQKNIYSKTWKQQVKILKVLSKTNIQVKAVLDKLIRTVPGIVDEDIPTTREQRSFLTRFQKAFQVSPQDHMQVIKNLNEGVTKVFTANRRDSSLINRDFWKTNYNNIIDKPGLSIDKKIIKASKLLSAASNLFETKTKRDELARTLKSALKSIGIEVSDGYIKYSLSIGEYAQLDGETKDHFEHIKKITKDDLNNLLKNVNKNFETLFSSDFGGKGSSLSLLTRIAKADSNFRDDLFETTYRDAAGKKRYVYVLPSHYSETIEEVGKKFNTVKKIDKIKDSPNSYLHHNPLFQHFTSDQLQTFMSNIRIALTGDLREEVEIRDGLSIEKDGVTNKTTDEKSAIITEIDMWENGWVVPMILSDKSSLMAVQMSDTDNKAVLGGLTARNAKGNVELTDEAVDLMYSSVFYQEYKRLKGDYKPLNKKFKNNDWVNLLPFKDNEVITKLLGIKRNKKGVTIGKKNLTPADVDVIKRQLKIVMNQEIKGFVAKLRDNNILIDSKDKEGSPTVISRTIFKGSSDLMNSISDYVVSNYLMTTGISQLVQGDLAKAKDIITRVKRNAGEGAYGISFERDFDVMFTEDLTRDILAGELDASLTGDEAKVVIGTSNIDDAQVLITGSRFVDMLEDIGELKTEEDFMYADKISNGLLSEEELKRKALYNEVTKKFTPVSIDLISWKDVYYDGDIYNKMSSFALIKPLTSTLPTENREAYIELLSAIENTELSKEERKELKIAAEDLWVPIRGMEGKHNKRRFMEINDIKASVPISASKLYSTEESNILKNDFFDVASNNSHNVTTLSGKSLRLQVSNKSTKSNNPRITAPTQTETFIVSEIPTDVEFEYRGKKWETGQDLIDNYYELLQSRLIMSIDNKLVEFEGFKDPNSRNIKIFLNHLRETAEESGAGEHILAFLEGDGNGDSKFDLNMPHIVTKIEEGFLNSFKKGVLSQKISGRKLTLVSDNLLQVVVDSKNNVIDYEAVKAFPKDYLNHETRELRIHHNKEGKIEFAEALVTRGKLELLGMTLEEIKEASPETLEMLGVRIPTQAHHSMIPLKIVGFLPEAYGDTIIVPNAITHLAGSDYDIDKLFTLIKDTYINEEGQLKAYGSAITTEEKREEFLAYEKANNKVIKSLIKNNKHNSEAYQKVISTASIEDVSEERELLEDRFFFEAMEELGMADYFDADIFANMENKTNIGAINNNLLDIKLAVMSNSAMSEAIFTPATTQSLEDDADFMEDRRGLDLGGGLLNSPLGKAKAATNNRTGNRNVGPAASTAKVSAILTRGGQPLSPSHSPVFDGDSYMDYSQLLEEDITLKGTKDLIRKAGKNLTFRKADTLSTFVSMMTDNAKLLGSNRLNFTEDNLGVFMNMISLGVGRARVSLFASQPAILEISKKFTNKKSAIEGLPDSKTDIIKEEAFKYFAQLKKLDFSKEELKEIPKISTMEKLQEFMTGYYGDSISTKSMYDNIGTTETKDRDFIFTQLQSALLYSKMNEVSSLTFILNKVISLNKGAATSMEDFDSLVEDLKSVGLIEGGDPRTIENNKDILDIKAIVDNNPYYSQQVESVKEIEDLSKYVFLHKTDTFNEIKKVFNNSIDRGSRDDFNSRFKQGFLSYLSTKSFDSFLRDTGNSVQLKQLDYILYPEKGVKDSKTLARIFRGLLNEEEFRNNTYVRNIEVQLVDNKANKKGYDILNGHQRTGLTLEEEAKITNGFDELLGAVEDEMTSDPAINKKIVNFAKFSRAYFLIKDGLQFKADSTIKYTNPELYIPIGERLKTITHAFATNTDIELSLDSLGLSMDSLLTEFKEIFFRWEGNKELVKFVKASNPKITKKYTTNGKVDSRRMVDEEAQFVNYIESDEAIEGKSSISVHVGTGAAAIRKASFVVPKATIIGNEEGITYTFPEYITKKKSGNKVLFKLDTKRSTLDSDYPVGVYNESSFVGNPFQSPYHSDMQHLEAVSEYLKGDRDNVRHLDKPISVTPTQTVANTKSPAQSTLSKQNEVSNALNLVAELNKQARALEKGIKEGKEAKTTAPAKPNRRQVVDDNPEQTDKC